MWNCLEAPPGGLAKALQVSSCLQFFLPQVSISFPFHRGLWQPLSVCACLSWSSMWISSEMTELGALGCAHVDSLIFVWWTCSLLSSPPYKFDLAKIPVHENSQGESFHLFLLVIIYSLGMTHQRSDLQGCGCVVCACLGTAARHGGLNHSSKCGKCVWADCLLFLK